MSEKLPVLVRMFPSPTTTEKIPCPEVVTSLVSEYSTVPDSELSSTESRRLIFWLAKASPAALRAMP